MKDIFNTYRPEGFSTVNSYLMTENPLQLIDFIKTAFYGKEISRTIDEESGIIRNCIVKIGDTCFMIAQANGDFLNMRTSFYLYVNDVDFLHQHALSNGAKELFGPDNMPYGDRQSGIVDPEGNYWWISKRLEEISY